MKSKAAELLEEFLEEVQQKEEDLREALNYMPHSREEILKEIEAVKEKEKDIMEAINEIRVS